MRMVLAGIIALATILGVSRAAPAVPDPCTAPLPGPGAVIAGTVSEVFNGESFCVGRAEAGIKVRLADFRACATEEPEGRNARLILDKIVAGKAIVCVAGTAARDAVLATCTVEGHQVAEVLRAASACERVGTPARADQR
jgi:micrococcal nuclease